MTKLGTPIGAGPKGAIVVVGLPAVGAPPAEYCEPPSPASGAGWSPPPLALVAVTAPLVLPPLGLSRPSLWVTPSLPAGAPPTIPVPCLMPPLPGAAAGEGSGAGGSRSGSSSSTRPSPSSSSPLAQAGACSEGAAVVVVGAGSATDPWERGSAPAKALPSAATKRKPAKARISAYLVLIPKRPCPCSDTPPWAVSASYPLVRASATRSGAPNTGLINGCNIDVTEDFQASRMRSLSCCDLTYEDYEQDGLRARAEQALGEVAQALIDNPTLHDAVTAALGAREKALEAQQAAMSALNLPSATDVERL